MYDHYQYSTCVIKIFVFTGVDNERNYALRSFNPGAVIYCKVSSLLHIESELHVYVMQIHTCVHVLQGDLITMVTALSFTMVTTQYMYMWTIVNMIG